MRRIQLVPLAKNFCPLISFFLSFQIIFLMPKLWISASIGLAIAGPVQVQEKQVGKSSEFNGNQNPDPQIKLPKISAPSFDIDHAEKVIKPDLKKPEKKKLTLEAAINQALEANRALRDVMDQVEGTRLSLVATESEFELKILPAGDASIGGNSGENSISSLGAGISLEKKFGVGTNITVTPQTRKTDGLYSTSVNTELIQPLLRGFGEEYNLSGVRSAEFGTRSARRNLYLRRVSTVLLTVNAVYDVIRQRELYRLNKESAQRLRANAEAAIAKKRIDMANQIDVYRATIQQKQAEDNLNTAREAYNTALDNLKILLSLPLDEEIEVEAPLKYNLVRLSHQLAVAAALKNRVELDQAEDNIREADRLSKVAKHNIWPDLNVVLNYSRFGTGDTFGNSTGFDQNSWNIGLETSTDFARTAEHAAYDQSLLNVQSAQRNFNLLRDEVITEVNRNFGNLRAYEKSIANQEEQIRQAKGQLELSQVKFKWGMANNFDLIDAETKLRGAQTSLLSAVINYIVGTDQLRASMGTLLERPKKF